MIAPPPGGIHGFYDEKMSTPVVVPIRKEHLDNAYESIDAAFKNDPMFGYINEKAKKPGPRRQALVKSIWKFTYGHSMKRKLIYTVNAGDAVLVAAPAERGVAKPTPVEHAIDFVLDAVANLLGYLTYGRERMKRYKEVHTKADKLRDEKLGDSQKEMIYINILATKPESQGKGYGSALLKTVLSMVQGRYVHLVSSNIANTLFYESFGFSIVGQVVLGDDNPKWHKPPVVVPIMVRKPGSGNNDL
ncbi:hypothetical protein M0805_006960 [Coniferiporia weirii]|nr:hypothetical protein M0805_006960 [Coniferiporia weirii]